MPGFRLGSNSKRMFETWFVSMGRSEVEDTYLRESSFLSWVLGHAVFECIPDGLPLNPDQDAWVFEGEAVDDGLDADRSWRVHLGLSVSDDAKAVWAAG